LAPAQRPGEFTAWVLVDGDMYNIPLQVPRVFYLNTQASNTEDYPGVRVTRTLPHGRPVFNLLTLSGLTSEIRDTIIDRHEWQFSI
jgi:DNA polymerase epsilon subunit 1